MDWLLSRPNFNIYILLQGLKKNLELLTDYMLFKFPSNHSYLSSQCICTPR
jgi:hypothetical protein